MEKIDRTKEIKEFETQNSELKLNRYLVGKFYEPTHGIQFLDPKSKDDLIVYLKPEKENLRVISSLEGNFVTANNLEKISKDKSILLVKVDQMKEFEEKYFGMFDFEYKK